MASDILCKECDTLLVNEDTLKFGAFVFTCKQCNTQYRVMKTAYGTTCKHVANVIKSRPITREASVWYENEKGDIVKPPVTPDPNRSCVLCKTPCDVITSHYGRVVTGFTKMLVDRVVTLQLENKGTRVERELENVKLPMFSTGVICHRCFPEIALKTYVKDGEVRPWYVGLAWPSISSSRDYRNQQHGGMSRADKPDRILSVTEVASESDTEIIEWEVPKSLRGVSINGETDTELDANSYRHFYQRGKYRR